MGNPHIRVKGIDEMPSFLPKKNWPWSDHLKDRTV